MTTELFGPRRCVDELLSTLSNYDCSRDLTDESCLIISKIVDLLTRYAIQSCDKKTAEKVWLHFQTLVPSLDLSKILDQPLHAKSLTAITEFNSNGSSQKTKDMCGFGLDRPSFRRFCSDSTYRTHSKRETTTKPWPQDQIINFHALYFGPSSEKHSFLDCLVTLLKALAILATSFNNQSLLTTIFEVCNRDTCAVELDYSGEFKLTLTNWLTLVNLSVLIGMGMCRKGQVAGDVPLELTLSFCLKHVDKLMSVQMVLDQLQIHLEDSEVVLELNVKLMDLVERFLVYSVELLQLSCSVTPALPQQFTNNYAFNLLNMCECYKTSDIGKMCQKPCPNHICFYLFIELCGNIRRDRDTWKDLLQVYLIVPPLFCECVEAQEVLKSVMFVTDQALLDDFILVLKHHFKDSFAIRNAKSPAVSHYYNDIFTAWTTTGVSISAHKLANQLLEVFELVSGFLSLEDFTDFGQKLLLLLQNVKTAAQLNDVFAINIREKATLVFAHHLRASTSFVSALIGEVVLELDEAIYYDSSRQKSFFILIQSILQQADSNQFHNLMAVLLEKYQQILKMEKPMFGFLWLTQQKTSDLLCRLFLTCSDISLKIVNCSELDTNSIKLNNLCPLLTSCATLLVSLST
uniref:Uncharacterized protein n=1 Tax=Ditylenchus dipsaci TaxID=166011 RepID=A0A915DQQ1_9BILA